MHLLFLKYGEHVRAYQHLVRTDQDGLRPCSVVAEENAGDWCQLVDCQSLFTDTTVPLNTQICEYSPLLATVVYTPYRPHAKIMTRGEFMVVDCFCAIRWCIRLLAYMQQPLRQLAHGNRRLISLFL
jgi:hypothetical protein